MYVLIASFSFLTYSNNLFASIVTIRIVFNIQSTDTTSVQSLLHWTWTTDNLHEIHIYVQNNKVSCLRLLVAHLTGSVGSCQRQVGTWWSQEHPSSWNYIPRCRHARGAYQPFHPFVMSHVFVCVAVRECLQLPLPEHTWHNSMFSSCRHIPSATQDVCWNISRLHERVQGPPSWSALQC